MYDKIIKLVPFHFRFRFLLHIFVQWICVFIPLFLFSHWSNCLIVYVTMVFVANIEWNGKRINLTNLSWKSSFATRCWFSNNNNNNHNTAKLVPATKYRIHQTASLWFSFLNKIIRNIYAFKLRSSVRRMSEKKNW